MKHPFINLLKASRGSKHWAWFAFFSSFLVYLFTLSPDIGSVDSGELSLAVETLGISHPTGYPLYTLLGKVWTLAILGGRLAHKLNILSAVSLSAATALLALTAMELGAPVWIALAAGLLWAFSPLVWGQATVPEVYGLTCLIGIFLIWLALKFRKNGDIKYLLLSGFVAGLGLGNHATLLWYLPGCLLLAGGRLKRELWPAILLAISLFVLGLTIYLYLPIRANLDPLFNWGNPSNVQRFLWHISGRQYQVWMLNNSLPDLFKNLVHFARSWSRQPGIYISWVCLPGLVYTYIKNRTAFWAFLTVFATTLLYAINHSIPDAEAYYLPALAVSMLWVAWGLLFVHEAIKKYLPRIANYLSLLLCVTVVVAAFCHNYKTSNRRNNNFSYDFATDIFISAEPDAVILTDNRDFYDPCLYLQNHEGFRKDVCLIDGGLLKHSWYYRYLGKRYPDMFASCKAEIDAFLGQLTLYETKQKYDAFEIQRTYQRLLNALLLHNYYDRPPYITSNAASADYKNVAEFYERIPEGLLYRLRPAGSFYEFYSDTMFTRNYKTDTLRLTAREKRLYKIYPKMYYERGLICSQLNMYSEAVEQFKKALLYDSKHPRLYLYLGASYMGLGKAAEALACFELVLKLDPGNPVALDNINKLSPFVTPGGGLKAFKQELTD
jgi:tetratricopeptide (TPR) repeat protein